MKGTSHQIESRLAAEYETALRDYLSGNRKFALERAYEVGCQALADGRGMVDIVRLHHAAIASVLPSQLTAAERLKAAETLLIQSLAPFEATREWSSEAYVALQVSEERYRELFDNANDIVFTADLDGNLSSINRAGERLSGYRRNELISTNFTSLVAPEYVGMVRRALQAKLSGTDEDTRYEVEILTKDGRRLPIDVNTRLIRRNGVPVGVQGIARDMTERRQAAQAARRLNDELETRARRIAHALHDEAGQMLVAVYLAAAEIADEVPVARERLARIPALLDQVGEELRRLSHELRPVILDDFGLVPAVEFLAKGISKRTGLVITVEACIEERLPSPIETTLYRIFQEALTNVNKHAHAKRASIKLGRNGGTVSGSISDDGIGIDRTSLFPQTGNRGFGLVGIRERLGGIGGTLSITSAVNQGTTLEFLIPIEPY